MKDTDMKHLQKSGQYFVLVLALLLLVLISLMARRVVEVRIPPPFSYSNSTFYPLAPVCPGQTLQWRSEYTFSMKNEFVSVQIARIIYDVQARRPLGPDMELEYYIWTASERNIPIQTVQRYVLPKDLPVGQYELRVAARAGGTEDTGYRVPFVIPVSCKKGGRV